MFAEECKDIEEKRLCVKLSKEIVTIMHESLEMNKYSMVELMQNTHSIAHLSAILEFLKENPSCTIRALYYKTSEITGIPVENILGSYDSSKSRARKD